MENELARAFAPIPGGWFTMGTELGHEDERPPHRVFVDAFELGVCPVTRAQYEHFVDASADTGMSKWILTGTTREGERKVVHGCDFWTFRDGKVIRKDSYWKIVE